MKNINEVILAGKIENIKAMDSFTGAKLAIDSGHKTKDGASVINRINVVAFGYQKDTLGNLKEEENVIIKGRFSVSNKEDDKDASYNVIAETITRVDAGNYNKCIIQGRLTKDPQVTVTQQNNSLTSFTLATDYQYKKDDSFEAITSFIPVTYWGELSDDFKKGSLVWLCGELRPRSYESNDVRHYVTDVYANEVKLGGTGKTSTANDTENPNNNSEADNNNEVVDVSQNEVTTDPDGFMDINIEIEEELPF